jgi:hypothetical protein
MTRVQRDYGGDVEYRAQVNAEADKAVREGNATHDQIGLVKTRRANRYDTQPDLRARLNAQGITREATGKVSR